MRPQPAEIDGMVQKMAADLKWVAAADVSHHLRRRLLRTFHIWPPRLCVLVGTVIAGSFNDFAEVAGPLVRLIGNPAANPASVRPEAIGHSPEPIADCRPVRARGPCRDNRVLTADGIAPAAPMPKLYRLIDHHCVF